MSSKNVSETFRIGLVVDGGPTLGYGHAVRCLRIAREFPGEIILFPLSQACRRFYETNGMGDLIQETVPGAYPPVMITDLREPRIVTRLIHDWGSFHISIHDMGLAQCPSDIAIDGSIAHAVPYPANSRQTQFLGPQFMITRPVIARAAAADVENTVLLTLGGGSSAQNARRIAEMLRPLGLSVVTTSGFSPNAAMPPLPENEIRRAMAHCRFAITTAGTSLYDLLASGVPTIAVAVDRLQLRTAEAFQQQGATLSAGLLNRLADGELLDRCRELCGDAELASRMTFIGKDIVDGQGLRRVVEIIENFGREQWKTQQIQTSTVC